MQTLVHCQVKFSKGCFFNWLVKINPSGHAKILQVNLLTNVSLIWYVVGSVFWQFCEGCRIDGS
jgi:hypothetical protein